MENEILEAARAEIQKAADLAEPHEVPTSTTLPSGPARLDEVDLLKYQLLGSRINAAELKTAMYLRELQHAEIEKARLTHEMSQHVQHIEQKYGSSLRDSQVTEDGYIIARPAQRI